MPPRAVEPRRTVWPSAAFDGNRPNGVGNGVVRAGPGSKVTPVLYSNRTDSAPRPTPARPEGRTGPGSAGLVAEFWVGSNRGRLLDRLQSLAAAAPAID